MLYMCHRDSTSMGKAHERDVLGFNPKILTMVVLFFVFRKGLIDMSNMLVLSM